MKKLDIQLITAAVLAGFYMMFTRIVDRYSARIAAQPQKTTVWQTFPLRGWILIVCMTCLGIVLKHIPAVPAAFTASFYSGLGPMLLLAALVMSASMLAVGCKSNDTMYGRKQSNKGATVKSNIKVKGSNKANGHTTRSY